MTIWFVKIPIVNIRPARFPKYLSTVLNTPNFEFHLFSRVPTPRFRCILLLLLPGMNNLDQFWDFLRHVVDISWLRFLESAEL